MRSSTDGMASTDEYSYALFRAVTCAADDAEPAVDDVVSNAPAAVRHVLMPFLLDKLRIHHVYDNGSVDRITSDGDKHLDAFVCILGPVGDAAAAPPAPTSTVYVLALLCRTTCAPDQVLFELFAPDLSAYASQLRRELPQLLEDGLVPLNAHLQRWFHLSIAYLYRVVHFVADALPAFLHLCMTGSEVHVHATPVSPGGGKGTAMDEMVSDVESFIKRARIITLPSGECGAHDDEPVDLNLCREPLLPPNDNRFCQLWAMQLLKAPDAFVIRRVIVQHQAKVVLELNTLRQRVEAACDSHYALYSALHYVRHTANANALLSILTRVSQRGPVTDTLKVLQRHLSVPRDCGEVGEG